MKKPEPQSAIDSVVQRRLNALERLIDTEYAGSVKTFETKTGIKMAQVNQWFSGYRALRDKALRRLEEATDKPAGYFDGITGMLTNIQTSYAGEPPAEYTAGTEILQFDTGGKMGHGLVLRDQPGMIQGWRVSPEWIQKNVHNFSSVRNLAIVTGFGDSMRPLYNPGDPLLVDRGVTTVDYDAIYFFRVGDEGFVKRLQRVPGNGLLVISENRSYRDWSITSEMDFEVFARVIKVWRGEDF